MSVTGALEIEYQKPQNRQNADGGEHDPNIKKYFQCPVHGIHADHVGELKSDEFRNASEQTGFACFGIGVDRDMGNSHLLVSCLDQHFDRVTEGGDDVETDSGLSGDSPEAAYCIWHLHSAQFTDNTAAETLQQFL